MRVARVEPVGDAPAGLVERDILKPYRPLAGQGPLVEAQTFEQLINGSKRLSGPASHPLMKAGSRDRVKEEKPDTNLAALQLTRLSM
jgi:hypothetical protein